MPFSAEIFYRTYEGGTGDFRYPIVLLHGAGSSHLGWPWQLRRMPGLNVYAIDLPAHGNSDRACCSTLEELTQSLALFFDRMKWNQVILIGHSLGGAAALKFSADHPERVRGLILIGCGNAFQVPAEIMDLLRPPAKLEKAVHWTSNTAFAPAFPHPERNRILAPMLKLRPSTLLSDWKMCDQFQLPAGIDGFHQPVLLLSGDRDQLASPVSLRGLRDILPSGQLSLLPDAGHMLMFEKTEVVAEKIREFLRGTRIAEYGL